MDENVQKKSFTKGTGCPERKRILENRTRKCLYI